VTREPAIRPGEAVAALYGVLAVACVHAAANGGGWTLGVMGALLAAFGAAALVVGGKGRRAR
jgi:hypothetical protein